MSIEIPQPGVEVRQVIRTTSPTTVTPTLVPCVIGVCKQVVSVTESTDTGGTQLNPKALVASSAYFMAKFPEPYALDGEDLVFSAVGSPDVTVSFSGASLSAKQIVKQVNDALEAMNVTEAFAEVYNFMGTDRLLIRTVAKDAFQTIDIKAGTTSAVLSSFGVIIGETYSGWSVYNQGSRMVPPFHMPDPNSNLSQLVFEPDSVRVFLAMGSGVNVREFSRTSSHLKKGGGGSSAQLTGSVDLSTLTLPADVAGLTLTVTIDAGTPVVVTLTGATNIAHLLQIINTALGGMYASHATGLRFTSQTKGTSSTVAIAGTATTLLGFTTGNNSNTGKAGVTVVDDGNGDLVSPLFEVVGENFSASPTSAIATGVVDLTTLTLPGDLTGKTLTLSISGRQSQTYTFDSSSSSAALVASNLQSFFTNAAFSLSSNFLVITSTQTGEDGTIQVLGGTAADELGLVPYVDGAVDLATIYVDLTALNTKKLKVSTVDGTAEVTFSGLSGTTASSVSTFLNSQPAFSALAVATIATGGKLRLRAKTGGLVSGSTKAFISVDAASSNDSAQYLGFNTGQRGVFYRFEGRSFQPLSGDDFYVDGVLVGRILQISPGGVATRLKISKQFAINSAYGTNFHIIAKNLTQGSTTPTPELVVASNGAPVFKHDVLRDTDGNVLISQAFVYVAYRALRKDVTPSAKTPGLLRVSSTTELGSLIPPVNTLNPLALGLNFALLNAPGVTVSGIGVDETSEQYPDGTPEAYARVAEFLEAYEVYGLAPLTQDETVGELMAAHVKALSEPANKGERVVVLNHKMPLFKPNTLVASGPTCNSSDGLQVDTGIANLASLVLNKGVNPVGTIPANDGLFLDISSDDNKYSISSISGSVVTIRTTFSSGENDDLFYATAAISPTPVIDETFSVSVRGAPLVAVNGTIDKLGVANAYQAMGQRYGSRRVIHLVPESIEATIDGVDQIIPGYYAAACKAGMMGGQVPQQSFTNFPMIGIKRTVGVNDFFSSTQLNIIAGGGNDILFQLDESGPVLSRMALTTDVTSVETRTDSITRIVDFTAKFLRRGIRAFIGRYNITQPFLDTLGTVAQGLGAFLTNTGTLIGIDMQKLIQDETQPDALLGEFLLDVPYPCNYIRLTLVI